MAKAAQGRELLSEAQVRVVDECVAALKSTIEARAVEILESRLQEVPDDRRVDQAAIAPVAVAQAIAETVQSAPVLKSRLETFVEYFTPFTCVCTVLCLAFAGLGLWAIKGTGGGSEFAKATSGFLDIAKIFAGAIVGSTASAVVGAHKARRAAR